MKVPLFRQSPFMAHSRRSEVRGYPAAFLVKTGQPARQLRMTAKCHILSFAADRVTNRWSNQLGCWLAARVPKAALIAANNPSGVTGLLIQPSIPASRHL